MRGPRRLATMVTALAVLTTACGGESGSPSVFVPTAPTAPAFVPPPLSGPTVALSGMVTDAAGSPLSATVDAIPLRFTAAWAGAPRSSQAMATGQYRFPALPAHPDTVYVHAWKMGYVQQCATPVTLQADTSVDVTLTPHANVRLTGLPTAPNARHVSGVVYEMSAGGRRPVAGALVGWEPVMDTVVADTRTDSEGRYRLCGLPTGSLIGVYAVRAGTIRPVYASPAAGGDVVIDFELP